jgi:RNA polymerase sigma factor (sigma-70 family)
MHKKIEEHFKANYFSWVKRINHRVKNIPDAEDIVMEAYTRALQYQNTYNPDNPFDNWFSRIVSNCVKAWKQQQHNQHAYAEEFNENEMNPITDPSIRNDLYTTLQVEIAKVKDENHQEILRLHYLQGYKAVDIVQITNNTHGCVKMTIHHFKHRCKEKYME